MNEAGRCRPIALGVKDAMLCIAFFEQVDENAETLLQPSWCEEGDISALRVEKGP